MSQSVEAPTQPPGSSSGQGRPLSSKYSSRRSLYPRSRSYGPIGRSGHRILASDANIYLLAGYNPSEAQEYPQQLRNMFDFPMIRDLWRYHIATDRWHQLPQYGDIPTESASYCAALCGSKIFHLGGTGYPFSYFGGTELHVFDLITHEWTTQECNGDSLPDVIYGHSWIQIDDLLYIFGGTAGHEYYNDVFTLNLETFTITELKLAPGCGTDNRPAARYKQEIATDGNCIYVFGGGTASTLEPLSTVWRLDIAELNWERLDTLPDPRHGFPSARKCHSSIQTDTYVIISGGESTTTALKDMWKFTFSDSQWARLKISLPTALIFHSSVSPPSDKSVLYNFGGVIRLNGKEIRSKRLTQITFDVRPLSELVWEKLVIQGNLQPSKRKDLLQEGIPARFLDRLDYEAIPAAAS